MGLVKKREDIPLAALGNIVATTTSAASTVVLYLAVVVYSPFSANISPLNSEHRPLQAVVALMDVPELEPFFLLFFRLF